MLTFTQHLLTFKLVLPHYSTLSFQSKPYFKKPIAFSPQLHAFHTFPPLSPHRRNMHTYHGDDERSANVHSCKHDVHLPRRHHKKSPTLTVTV